MSDFIDDGYTEQGYIAASALHGPLEFQFRPALVKLGDRVQSLIAGEYPNFEAFGNEAAKALARDPGLLKSWSLKDRSGNAVPITEANLLKVRNQMFHKLWLIVSCHRESDPRPDGSQTSKSDVGADAKN